MSQESKTKKMAIIGGGVAVLCIGAFVVLNLGTKSLIEKIASQALQTKVEIGSLDISIQNKEIHAANIRIHNLKGFKKDNILTVKDILVQADSLTGDSIVFNTVAVTGMEVTYEMNEAGINFSKLKKQLGSSSGSSRKAKEKSSGKSKSVVIKKLSITESKVNAAILIGDVKEDQSFSLPNITMKNIGRKSNPIPAEQAIARVVKKISSAVVTAASREGLKDKVKGLTNKLSEGMKGMFSR